MIKLRKITNITIIIIMLSIIISPSLVFAEDVQLFWSKVFGNVVEGNRIQEYFGDVIETDDGYIVVGESRLTFERGGAEFANLNRGGSSDAIIVKYNSNGTREWIKSFGGSGTDKFVRIIRVNDGYVLIGQSSSRDGDLLDVNDAGSSTINMIVKYSDNWNIQWKKYYTFPGPTFRDIIQVEDSKYIITGGTPSARNDLVL